MDTFDLLNHNLSEEIGRTVTSGTPSDAVTTATNPTAITLTTIIIIHLYCLYVKIFIYVDL